MGDIKLSIIIPAFNEESNILHTFEEVKNNVEKLDLDWEIIFVDDGSTDNTASLVNDLCLCETSVRLVSYKPNQGRGTALRTGFKAARGEIIVSTDADLSYHPKYINQMVSELLTHPELDLILASPYMPGGGTKDVPWLRLWISKLGNKVLSFSLPDKVFTITCVFRAYRREVLDSMEIKSNGKEIHLEILSKALALGFKLKEIPAILTSRKSGKSKFKFRKTAGSHLTFTFLERPMMLFGGLGLLCILGGIGIGFRMYFEYAAGSLNPIRPLMSLLLLLLIGGLSMFSMGVLAVKLNLLRKEIYEIQRENLKTQQMIESLLKRREEGSR